MSQSKIWDSVNRLTFWQDSCFQNCQERNISLPEMPGHKLYRLAKCKENRGLKGKSFSCQAERRVEGIEQDWPDESLFLDETGAKMDLATLRDEPGKDVLAISLGSENSNHAFNVEIRGI